MTFALLVLTLGPFPSMVSDVFFLPSFLTLPCFPRFPAMVRAVGGAYLMRKGARSGNFLPSCYQCAGVDLAVLELNYLNRLFSKSHTIAHHLFASNVLAPSYSRRFGHGLTKRTTGKIMLEDARGSKKTAD